MALATAPDSTNSRSITPVDPPLRVFVSYKAHDLRAASRIASKLREVAGDNTRMDVFVAGDEEMLKAGQEWRKVIIEKLRAAHVLIFLYSDPSRHWDWCLYETGYFDGRQAPEEVDRRLYVLHRADVSPAGPFLGLRTVPVCALDAPDEPRLRHMLQTLFVDSTAPAVNSAWHLHQGASDLVAAFKEPFGGIDQPPREYIRRLTYRLPKGPATLEALKAAHVPGDAAMTGRPESFQLFNLGASDRWTWADLEGQWRERVPAPTDTTEVDPVALWIAAVARNMLAAIRGEAFGDGLPLFYCPFVNERAKALFRPSLAQMTERADTYDFDVVFVDVPEEMCAVSSGPLSTAGQMLRLAHMFRFGWIEPMHRKLVTALPAGIPDVVREIWDRLSTITAESFNQGLRTEAAVLDAFQEDSPLQDQARNAMATWKTKVAPALEAAAKAGAVDQLRCALRQASDVNWEFHRACALRYAELIEEYASARKGPGDRL